jgi:hypothetical protein
VVKVEKNVAECNPSDEEELTVIMRSFFDMAGTLNALAEFCGKEGKEGKHEEVLC